MSLLHNLTYHLTINFIKIKGIKRVFQQSPLPLISLRKEDVHLPSKSYLKKNSAERFLVSDSTVTQLTPSDPNGYLIIHFHGGAFVSGPTKYHWNSLAKISKQTNAVAWLCDYPKAPEANWESIIHNVQCVYRRALGRYPADKIILLGDSVGGTLSLNIVQEALLQNDPLPKALFLLSPVVDLSLSNPDSLRLESKDPMLSIKGLKEAKQMIRASLPLDHENLSPLFSRVKGLPMSYWYIAEHDVTFPDQLLMVERLKRENIKFFHNVGEKMPHFWPILPVMTQSSEDLKRIIAQMRAEMDSI